MKWLREWAIRLADVSMKSLVFLPFYAFLFLLCRQQEFNLPQSADQIFIGITIIFVMAYGPWSAFAVLIGRRKPEHTGWWALAALPLWLIAIPGFGNLVRKSAEHKAITNLALIRTALSLYHGDMGKSYPASIESLTVGGKYLVEVPKSKLPNYHADSSHVTLGKIPNDSGGWLYNGESSDKEFGSVRMNCTHTDTRGSNWSSY